MTPISSRVVAHPALDGVYLSFVSKDLSLDFALLKMMDEGRHKEVVSLLESNIKSEVKHMDKTIEINVASEVKSAYKKIVKEADLYLRKRN